MAMTIAKQPFCAHEKLIISVVHGLTDHERCTAIMVGSTVLLSVYMPHSGRDIEALETVRGTPTEAIKAVAVDFFVGGDLNIEFRLMVILKAWTVSNDTGCTGLSAEEAATIQSALRKLRWLQLLQDFDCTVTSTWTNNEDNRKFHTWRAWGSRARKEPLDFIMGPKDLRSSTWYLNLVMLRTCDHFRVITELKTKKCVKGWAGWTPAAEVVLCPRSDLSQAVLRDAKRDWSFCVTGW